MTIDNDGDFSSQSFKYNAALVEKISDYVDPNSFVKSAKIVVRLKYLSNFWRSLEMLLINSEILNSTGLKTAFYQVLEILKNCSYSYFTC